MNFHLGQKLLCIRDDWFSPIWLLPPILPRKGGIYHFAGADDLPGFLHLDEIPHWQLVGPVFLPFVYESEFFRPLDERTTDISTFTKILAEAHKRELA